MAIDERRRVAARLRMSDERDAAGFVDCLLAEVVRGREFCEAPCEECHARLLGELADLMDPGESGQNLDRNQDTVQKELTAVLKVPECDRDALLELANEINDTSCDNHGELSVSLGDIWRWAQAIREALGKSDG